MKFEWDETKRATNLDKHGLDFELAHLVFASDTFTFEDNRIAYNEQRFVTLGLLNGIVVVLVLTFRTLLLKFDIFKIPYFSID